MRCLMPILFVLFLLAGHAARGQNFDYNKDYEQLLKRSKDPKDSLYYEGLLQRFRVNDKKLTVFETLALMIGYTGTKNYKPYAYLKTERAIKVLNDSARYEQVLKTTDTFLAAHPLSQQAIIEKAYAFHQLKQKDSSLFYKEQFGRIMAAMDWSNDGRTPETAMFAVGQRDGENFIDKYYHADLGRDGAVEDRNGNLCDMLEMKFKKDGVEKSLVFYFVIQHATNTFEE